MAAPGQVSSEQTQWELLVLEGPEAGRRIPLSSAAITIGRNGTCTAKLRDRKASKQHLQLTLDGRGYTVRDLGSTNGTFVGGQRIQGVRRLGEGDEIFIGYTRMMCRVCPKGEPASEVAELAAARKRKAQASADAVGEDDDTAVDISDLLDDVPPQEEAPARPAWSPRSQTSRRKARSTLGKPVSLREWLSRPLVAVCAVVAIITLVAWRGMSVLKDRPADSYALAPGIRGNLRCRECDHTFIGTSLKAPIHCPKCRKKTVFFISNCLVCNQDFLSELPMGAGMCPRCQPGE